MPEAEGRFTISTDTRPSLLSDDPCARDLTDSLELANFGIARFGDFSFDSDTDTARLFNGVCVSSIILQEGQPLWQLAASELLVQNISDETISFDARNALVTVGDWRVATNVIRSVETGLELEGVTFTGPDAFGTARFASYDLLTAVLSLEAVFAQDLRYRVQGERARFEGGEVIFENAEATTCLCDNALYVVRAPEINFAPEAGRLLIRDGLLDLLGLKIDLGREFDPSESFDDVDIPVNVSIVADDPNSDTDSSGLALRLPRLEVGPGARLELGVSGLFNSSPVRGDALLLLRRGDVRANFGVREGPRADFTHFVPLGNDFIVDFGMEIKHWADAEFLHDAFIGLSRRQVYDDVLADDRVTVYGRGFTSVSNQTIGTVPINDFRFGVQLEGRYELNTDLGTFSLTSRNNLTRYPLNDRFQYAFQVTPAWRVVHEGFTASLNYDRRFANRDSPFTSSHDRLGEFERLNGGLSISEPVSNNWVVQASASVSYDFRLLSGSRTRELRSLVTGAAVEYRQDDLFLRPSVTLQMASLLNNIDDDAVDAFVEADIGGSFNVYEFGLNTRVNLEPLADEETLEHLELRGALPIQVSSELELQPFMALDFAVTTRSGDLPLLSGHGLTVIWDGCCGELTLGYRQYRGATTTSIGFNLAP